MKAVAPSTMFAALLVAGAPAGASVSVEAPAANGKLVRVVVPDYPTAALARGQAGAVVVEGVVSGSGVLEAPRLTPASPQAAAFVAPLQAVLPHWRFSPPVAQDCRPTREPVKVRVDFEIDAGKPRIFATHAGGAASGAGKANGGAPDVPYPGGWAERGVEANVYARLEVDPSGNVTRVGATAYPHPLNVASAAREVGPPPRGSDLEPFVEETRRALARWKLAPAAAPRVVCREVRFRLGR